MAKPPEGMTILSIEPRNYNKIVELSQNTPNPYTLEELINLQARYTGTARLGIVAFFDKDFWKGDANEVVSKAEEANS